MQIDFLYWDGCPSHPEALVRLEAALARAGVTAQIRRHEVRSDDEANSLGFPGSPTIRIEGVDVQEAPVDGPIALTCRLYRTSDGRPSPLPDPATLDHAIQEAMTR